jgi:NAD(P)-dependent dehydrogenase (short-subunit alcohol dehydrogenase family)
MMEKIQPVRLKDKVAIITGAASGIGATCAQRFAQEGGKVVIVDMDDGAGQEVADLLSKEEGEAMYIHADVTKADEVQRMITETVDKHGRLDVLFNNAGINPTGDVVSTSLDVWERVMAVNLRGTFLGCKYGVLTMLKQDGGSIINMGSVSGLEAGPFSQTAYEVSKTGIIALTRSLAHDFGSKGIKVNCICPGGTATPMVTRLMEDMDKKSKGVVPPDYFHGEASKA